MLGVILVVSGPTVVGPLLNLVRPAERVQRTLLWEGLLIDPVGGILIPASRPFGQTVIQLLLGVLFVSISASVTPAW
jgi:hypothetical protein